MKNKILQLLQDASSPDPTSDTYEQRVIPDNDFGKVAESICAMLFIAESAGLPDYLFIPTPISENPKEDFKGQIFIIDYDGFQRSIDWESCNRKFPEAATFWLRKVPRQEWERERIDSLTDEQRMDIFNKYCTHCGSKDSGCQCWNDD